MKVAFVLQPWETIATPFEAGVALPTVAYHLARGLAAAGDRVAIYARRRRGQAAAETDGDGIEYRRFALPIEEPFWGASRRLEDLFDLGDRRRPLVSSPLYFRRFARRIARDLRSRGCDLAHLFTFPQLAGPLRRAVPDLKIVLHMECEFLLRFDHDRLSEQLREIDLILGCSQFISEGIRRRFPHLARRCRTVFNGVDSAAFRPAARDSGGSRGTKRLLYAGRLSPEKGVHVLLDALPAVLADHPEARLDLVGTTGLFPERLLPVVGGERLAAEVAPFYGRSFRARLARQWRADRRLRAMLERRLPAAARDRVLFRGLAPLAELGARYRQADLLVFPSVCNEAFGLPLVEAMASKLAVVATRTGGISEVVADGRSGVLVPPGDARSLAAAINRLLADPARRLELAAAGHQRALQLFEWSRICSALRDAYARIERRTGLAVAERRGSGTRSRATE